MHDVLIWIISLNIFFSLFLIGKAVSVGVKHSFIN